MTVTVSDHITCGPVSMLVFQPLMVTAYCVASLFLLWPGTHGGHILWGPVYMHVSGINGEQALCGPVSWCD